MPIVLIAILLQLKEADTAYIPGIRLATSVSCYSLHFSDKKLTRCPMIRFLGLE